jgi:hypothetical protein
MTMKPHISSFVPPIGHNPTVHTNIEPEALRMNLAEFAKIGRKSKARKTPH